MAGFGCQKSETKGSEQSTENTPTAEQRLHSQLSAGTYAVNAALDSIEQSLQAASELIPKAPALEEPLNEVKELINASGEVLGEFVEDPPPIETIEMRYAEFDERRLKAIEAGNDAMHNLNEALGILESVKDTIPQEAAADSFDLEGVLAAAVDDLIGAIEGFGGKVEEV